MENRETEVQSLGLILRPDGRTKENMEGRKSGPRVSQKKKMTVKDGPSLKGT